MANYQTVDDGDYTDIPDPNAVLAQQNAQFNQAMQSPDAQVRSVALQQRFSNANGQQIDQAQAVKTRLQSILAQVNAGADPNEDPINRNMRLASAMASGMVDVSPQLALQANQQLMKLSQAKQQQSILSTTGQLDRVKLDQATADLQESKLLSGSNVVTSASGTGQIFRTINRYDDKGNLRPDTDVATETAQALQDAKANGVDDAVVMGMDKYATNKGMLQAQKDKTAVEVANIKAQAMMAQRLQKMYAPSQAEATQFYNGAQSYHEWAVNANSMLNMLDPDNNRGMTPGATAQTFKTWLSNQTVNIKSLVQGGQLSPDDLSSIDNDSTLSTAAKAQVATLAWQLARSNFSGRITNQEISQAKSILGGLDANPKVGLENLSNVISQKAQAWDAVKDDHPRVMTDPAMGEQNQKLYQMRLQEQLGTLDHADRVRAKYKMPATDRGDLTPQGQTRVQTPQQQATSQGASAPQAAIDYLKSHPEMSDAFKQKYGYLPQ